MEYLQIGNKKYKASTIKKCRIILLVLGWIMLAIGVICIPVGGIFFILIGIFELFMSHKYKKALSFPSAAPTSDSVVLKPSSPAPITPASAKASSLSSGETKQKSESHKVAGTSYHINEIMSLAFENSDYNLSKKEMIEQSLIDEKVFQYTFSPIKTELIPEPTNAHDPNAVKVIVDGSHVGYIKSGSCSHIKKLLQSGIDLKITSDFFGGNYKLVTEDYDDDGNERYSLEKDSYDFSIKVTISY